MNTCDHCEAFVRFPVYDGDRTFCQDDCLEGYKKKTKHNEVEEDEKRLLSFKKLPTKNPCVQSGIPERADVLLRRVRQSVLFKPR